MRRKTYLSSCPEHGSPEGGTLVELCDNDCGTMYFEPCKCEYHFIDNNWTKGHNKKCGLESSEEIEELC